MNIKQCLTYYHYESKELIIIITTTDKMGSFLQSIIYNYTVISYTSLFSAIVMANRKHVYYKQKIVKCIPIVHLEIDMRIYPMMLALLEDSH